MKRIGPTRLQILLLVLARPQPRYTIPEIATRLGRAFYCVYEHLSALRKAGLVTWEPNKARTLRPTCRFEPAEMPLTAAAPLR